MKISKRLKEMEFVDSDVIKACETAKQMEDSGEYAEAAKSLGSWWRGVGKRPEVDDLPDGKRAAILSRVGALSGWLGSMRQIAGSQERAKDLISEGASLFETVHDWENWADTRSDLAICYWREGAFDEARVVLQDILGRDLIIQSELKAKILLRLVTIETSTKRFEVASFLLNQVDSLLKDNGNSLLLGKFYSYLGFTLRNQGEDQQNQDLLFAALENYCKAGLYYKKTRHKLFAANVENNLGNIYRLLADFENAHIYLDKAIDFFTKLKDRANAALAYESKAQAFLANYELRDAETAARASVSIISGDEKSILAESLTTLAIVLSRRGNSDEAIRNFNEAKETALVVGDREGAGNAVLTYIEELQAELSPIVFRKLYLEADELLRDSPKRSNAGRLQRIARKYFESGDPESVLRKEKFFNWKDFSLPEAICSYERELIMKALKEADGRVTKAAELLGVSHQSLSSILHKRHKNLLNHSIQRRRRGSLKKSN